MWDTTSQEKKNGEVTEKRRAQDSRVKTRPCSRLKTPSYEFPLSPQTTTDYEAMILWDHVSMVSMFTLHI